MGTTSPRESGQVSAHGSQRWCVAPDIAQERRMLRVAQARLAPLRGFGLWTATEVLMNEHGPLAPIWLQGIPQCSHVSQPKVRTDNACSMRCSERTDCDVSTASLTLLQGQVEGQINRLKCVKRQMYGRAHFELLRVRFLRAS